MARGKIVYPRLAEWIAENGITDGKMIDALCLTATAYLNRLRGITPFAGIEQEKLERMSGIPAAELLRKEGE